MRILYSAIGLSFLFLLAGCGSQRVVFHPSAVVPGADATAKVSLDQNNNTRLDLRVAHLADPDRLDPPREVYVVWAETEDRRTHNLGQLIVGSNKEGRLETATALRKFRLIVTAESRTSATAASPVGAVVISSDYIDVK